MQPMRNDKFIQALNRGIGRPYHAPLIGYVERHEPISDPELRNIIIGRLYDVIELADYDLIKNLVAIAEAFHFYAPEQCYGSLRAYVDWIRDSR